MALHPARHTYEPSRPLEPWLLGIARHVAIDHARRRLARLKREELVAALPEAAAQGDGPTVRGLDQALGRLSATQREAIDLLHVQGLSVEAAAGPCWDDHRRAQGAGASRVQGAQATSRRLNMRLPRGHEAIVERLVGDARPVRRLRAPAVRLVAWLLLPLALLASFAAWHVRPDCAGQLERPLFVLDLALLVLAAVVSAWLALRAGVPGVELRRRDVGLALGLGGVAVLLLTWGPVRADVPLGHFVRVGTRCSLTTVLLAALPLAALLAALRRGAPLQPAGAGALAGAGAGAGAFLVAAAAPRGSAGGGSSRGAAGEAPGRLSQVRC